VLRVPEWGWIFVEAKLSSPTSTYAGKPGKLEAWRQRYADPTPGLFDTGALKSANHETFPEQLLRNVAIAHAVRENGARAIVVALVRQRYANAVTEWGAHYVAPDAPVATRSVTWEQLYAALAAVDGCRRCATTSRPRASGCGQRSTSSSPSTGPGRDKRAWDTFASYRA
jgi:hypothetical protein